MCLYICFFLLLLLLSCESVFLFADWPPHRLNAAETPLIEQEKNSPQTSPNRQNSPKRINHSATTEQNRKEQKRTEQKEKRRTDRQRDRERDRQREREGQREGQRDSSGYTNSHSQRDNTEQHKTTQQQRENTKRSQTQKHTYTQTDTHEATHKQRDATPSSSSSSTRVPLMSEQSDSHPVASLIRNGDSRSDSDSGQREDRSNRMIHAYQIIQQSTHIHMFSTPPADHSPYMFFLLFRFIAPHSSWMGSARDGAQPQRKPPHRRKTEKKHKPKTTEYGMRE